MKEGSIAPGEGVDEEYDSIQQQISEINKKLEAHLEQQEKHFGCRLKYVGKDKNRFEIEVPEGAARRAKETHSLEGQRKGFKRYSTDETRQYLKEIQAAEDQRNNVLKDLLRRLFEKFSQEYSTWKCIIDCVATLDCLTALTVYGQNLSQFCFAEIVDSSDLPIIEIEDGYHPCMALVDDFIPNSVVLGGKTTAPLALLTGPNMGGKR